MTAPRERIVAEALRRFASESLIRWQRRGPHDNPYDWNRPADEDVDRILHDLDREDDRT